MKKNLAIILLLAALAVCIFFLLQGDKPHDTHTGDFAEIIKKDSALKANDSVYARVYDSLTTSEGKKDSTIKALKEGQAATSAQLKLKTAEVKSLAKEIQANNKDTGEQARRIDSLVEQVEHLTFLLVQYEQYADSLNLTNDSIRIGYEEKIKIMDHRYWQLKTAYDALINQWSNLFEKNRSLMKDAKRQKLKTKVLGVLGAVGAVLLLVK